MLRWITKDLCRLVLSVYFNWPFNGSFLLFILHTQVKERLRYREYLIILCKDRVYGQNSVSKAFTMSRYKYCWDNKKAKLVNLHSAYNTEEQKKASSKKLSFAVISSSSLVVTIYRFSFMEFLYHFYSTISLTCGSLDDWMSNTDRLAIFPGPNWTQSDINLRWRCTTRRNTRFSEISSQNY